jgi:tRNA wybutosine-synthesizing protein 3
MKKDYSDPANTRRLPLDWLEPTISPSDDADNNLPSFVDLQRKTIQTLYGVEGDDKSPKGSVDGPIQPFVDLLNRHSSYCTLSSCSGRLSLFDPNGRHEGIQGSTTADNDTNTRSGKGTGGWLLVSHQPIESSELVNCFPPSLEDKETADIPWIFKLEPLLLHVAARSLQRGRKLLRIALDLGFRESGLVVSDARVTVAIRGHSLALAVPLAPSGPLRPPTEFLDALIDQANQRLLQNWHQLDRLYERIQSNFFEVAVAPKVHTSSMPPLNLWNVASVTVPVTPSTGDSTAIDILVFGGYGQGPNSSQKSARRSSEIYKLGRRQNQWDVEWQQLVFETPPTGSDSLDDLSVSWVAQLPDCQGMGVCSLKSKNWIVLWGGRTSPKNALGDLFILNPTNQSYSLASPKDVRGVPPSPRWGHSLVAINDCTLVVVGGCNIDGAFNDIHVLHFCESFFYWELLSVTLPTPLFHHMTMVQDDGLFVFGGLKSTSQVLEPFENSNQSREQELLWACRVEEISKDSDGVMSTSVSIIDKVQSFKESGISGLKRFGASACSVDSLVVVSGGLAASDDGDPPPLESFFLSTNKEKVTITSVPIEYPIGEELDFGSLVHHSSVDLGSSEFLLLGGGATSFAFGNSFAK